MGINIGMMFLFHWFEYGDDIWNFEKIDFSVVQVILGSVGRPLGGENEGSCLLDLCISVRKKFLKSKKWKIFWKSFRETSKLSVDSFMDR